MWNRKHLSYFELTNNVKYAIRVKYEELLADPAHIIMRVNEEFHVQLSGDFQNIGASTKTAEKDFNTYQKFYLQELWKLKFDHQPTLKHINRAIDRTVLGFWNYTLWMPTQSEVAAAQQKSREEGKLTSWMLRSKKGKQVAQAPKQWQSGGTDGSQIPPFVHTHAQTERRGRVKTHGSRQRGHRY